MKLRHEILIDAPVETVWTAFDDPALRYRWQPTLTDSAIRSGTAREVGSVTSLKYREDGDTLEVTETVTERRAPDFLACVRTTPWGKSIVVNHFEASADDGTRWVVYANHFFAGIMKLRGFFLAPRIRERTVRDLERFKLLVESFQADRK